MSFATDDDQSNVSETNPAATEQTKSFSLKVGDRTYESVDEVTTKISHQDNHIAKLEEEAAVRDKYIYELEKRVESGSKVDDVLEKLNSVQKTETTTQVSNDELIKAAAAQAAQQLKDENTKVQNEINLTNSMAEAKAAYGDAFKTVVGQRAAELGMSISDVDSMAKTSPAVFKELFIQRGDQSRPRSAAPSQGSVKRNFNSPDDGERPKATNFLSMSTKQRVAHIRERMAELEKSGI